MSRINRYKFTKNIYPDYIVLLTRKNKVDAERHQRF